MVTFAQSSSTLTDPSGRWKCSPLLPGLLFVSWTTPPARPLLLVDFRGMKPTEFPRPMVYIDRTDPPGECGSLCFFNSEGLLTEHNSGLCFRGKVC